MSLTSKNQPTKQNQASTKQQRQQFFVRTKTSTQLAYNVVVTLGFGCILVATSDNVVTTLSQYCVSDVITTTKN